MVSRFKLSVEMVKVYLRCVDAQEAGAGAEGINTMPGFG
jgi:hypothetical protein